MPDYFSVPDSFPLEDISLQLWADTDIEDLRMKKIYKS